MSGKKTNEKIQTPIVIAISAVLVMVVIVAVALAIHLRRTAIEPNNIINNRNTITLPKDTTNKTSNKTINNNLISNNVVNKVVNNNTAINNIVGNNNIETNTIVEDTNTIVNNEQPQVSNEVEAPSSNPEPENIIPIKPNIKGKETIQEGELVYINDYKVMIPSELTKKGYEIAQKEDVIRNKSKRQFISMCFNAIIR